MILKHIDRQEIPVKWVRLLEGIMSPTYRITIEPESTFNEISKTDVKKSRKDMPMFGMWKDRDDRSDPVNYVRQL
ncbi:hypothetical protein QUF74_13310 [Candidatus Halobeggiatoa sp. HSG11]|nr:hypothetical protein [Candidatus Halobeggiatoa sp. HSG11]